ncbi:hypothetical protein [Streptomyces sp. ME19-01-6]|uniref:hypothetical protein n=1 Tax=Streptomyces sp. ME19-01-6 TaxID=3028686 RepID=UPI0029A10B95|nr:hypothetical protein [Streptomyces sp. ME19-01-6]MDX3228224.1 hypothetical protein [Streptomyces sp. ME19-01-6]
MSGPPPRYAEGRASEHGRVFQSAGDQHVTEHHHHYAPGASLFAGTTAPELGGPSSVLPSPRRR